jgi:RimJ/RimL family protein N-acetyltransferase
VTRAIAGIFVGGAGERMGGIAKGLLTTADGVTLVERTRTTLARLGLGVVLVGERPEYEGLGMDRIADQPAGVGPLGGLLALLAYAGQGRVLAFACDMPFVSGELVERLLVESPKAPILAPRRGGRWEPLCARYDPARVMAPALALARSTDRSLQRLLCGVGAEVLALGGREADELRDWDTPDDVWGRSLRTERLLLRPWRASDLAPFAEMNADARVMEHMPATLTAAESAALAARLGADLQTRAFGAWAVEAIGVAPFIGFVGLHEATLEAPFSPCIEIAWRLARDAWGHGYAAEAARAVLDDGFVRLGFNEILAWTVPANHRSRRLMDRLGMRHSPDEDFDHPRLPEGHPLRRHVLYRIRREPSAR